MILEDFQWEMKILPSPFESGKIFVTRISFMWSFIDSEIFTPPDSWHRGKKKNMSESAMQWSSQCLVLRFLVSGCMASNFPPIHHLLMI